MWHILGFQIYFCIGNGMSRVHGSIDPVIGGGLTGLPWTDRGQCGSLERERDNGRVVLTGSEGRRRDIRIEPTTEGNVGERCISSKAAYMRGGEEI
jgi:hypothetical protein